MRQNIYDDTAFFAGYQDLREKPNNFNNLVEQPALRGMLPPLAGLAVLDLGCGFGDLAAYCVEQGAVSIVATDISAKMLALGREKNPSPLIDYRQVAMEDLDFAPGTFDLVISSLALHYVADYRGLVVKVARWLRPSGHFVYSVEHPICTARRADQGWLYDEDGQKLCWPVDDYQIEGRREFSWFVDGVVKYHRTLTTLLNTLVGSGLTVSAVCEPSATEETIARLPYYESTRRFPSFLLVQSRKERV